MPIATPEVYAEMLDRAKAGTFAYPAINCTSSQTIVAAIRGFAEAESDGIVQFSWGGAEFASGQAVKDMVTGAVALAEFAHVVAEKYDVQIALHTDHCPKDKLDGYMRPLIDVSLERVAAGLEPLFQSHMWDGSAVPLEENLDLAEHARQVPPRQHHQSSRSASSAARRTASRRRTTPSCSRPPRTASPPPRPSASASAAATWSPRPSATCTASTSRATSSSPRHPQGDPDGRRREVRQGQAVRPRLPRRLRLAALGDPRGARLRRREDEHRHRHAVRVHAPGRRPHVHATTTAS